jgi:hypothetical protein
MDQGGMEVMILAGFRLSMWSPIRKLIRRSVECKVESGPGVTIPDTDGVSGGCVVPFALSNHFTTPWYCDMRFTFD